MTRRHFLQHSAALAGATLSGCDVGGASAKRHISHFGQTFEYLKDAQLRQQEKGDALITVEGAEISGAGLQGMEWRNILFKRCDFVGAYELKPKTAANVRFEDCRFSGIFSFGVATDIQFLRCGWTSESIAFAKKGSRGVIFKECQFVGVIPDPNHRGSVGSGGEAKFVRCKAKWFTWGGYDKLELIDCDLEACSIVTDNVGNSGANWLYSTLSIERSTVRGVLDLGAANLQSLSIRDSTIDTLDMGPATVKGDVLIERVKAERLMVDVEEGAGGFTLRDCQITGDGEHVFNTYAGAFRSILVENVSFGAASRRPVAIAGGYDLDDKRPQPRTLKSVTFRNVTVPWLKSSWLSTDVLRLENVQAGEVELQEGLIDSLEFNNLQVAKHIDLSKTRVKQFTQTGGTDLRQLGSGLKLEGSNIKLP